MYSFFAFITYSQTHLGLPILTMVALHRESGATDSTDAVMEAVGGSASGISLDLGI